jgi:bacterioferritin
VRTNDKVIEILNDILAAELTAINQYFVDAEMCTHWGYARLASRFHAESIGEMNDAKELIERILYLEGVPNMQALGSVRVGGTVAEKLSLALDLETKAVARLNSGIGVFIGQGDNGSRSLLESILRGEEQHAAWLETQLELVRQLGDALYLSQQTAD